MTILKDGELHRHESHVIHGNRERSLRVHLKAPRPYKCSGCEMTGSDPCFKYIYENCDFHLHKACFLAGSTTCRSTPFFIGCQFNYHESPPVRNHCGNVLYYCDACGLDIEGFMIYRCNGHTNNIYHDLHPTCASLKRQDKIVDEYGREFVLKDRVKSKCLHRGKRYPVKCILFTGLKWVCEEREKTFPFCFGGRKICYHLKCMNEILSSKGEVRIISHKVKIQALQEINNGPTMDETNCYLRQSVPQLIVIVTVMPTLHFISRTGTTGKTTSDNKF